MANVSEESIPELVSGVVGDLKDIAASHAGKMHAEVKAELSNLKTFLMKVMVAIGIGILGAILLAHAFALGLDALGLPLWLAYLISAAVFVAIGVVLVRSFPDGKADMDLVPESSIADLKRDVRTLANEVQHA